MAWINVVKREMLVGGKSLEVVVVPVMQVADVQATCLVV
jgi:hypothetical protein